jgi:Tol biopolymer transport system component
VLLFTACSVASIDVDPGDRLVLWGFDKVFLAYPVKSGNTIEPRQLAVDPTITDLVAASAAGRQLAVVGRSRDSHEQGIFVVDVQTGRVVNRLPRSAISVSFDRSGKTLAFMGASLPPARGLDLMLWNVGESAVRVLVEDCRSCGNVSWHPRGGELVFDGKDGWIHQVRVTDGQISRLVEGRSPAWSPDGRHLTYRRGQTAYLYDVATTRETPLVTRRWWQSEFNVGMPSWSPNGKVMTWNAEIGKDIDCILVDAATRRASSVYRGSYWCGPWVE